MKRDHWSEVPARKKYSLDRNENCDTLLKEFIRTTFFNTLDDTDITQYPNMGKAYKEAADLYNCNVENLFLTSGCEQGIKSILELCTNDLNIIPRLTYYYPTFGMVPVYANLYEYTAEIIPYEYKHTGFIAPLPEGGEVLYIADPDNPTGADLGYGNIQPLCNKFKVVILDKAYSMINTVVQYNKAVDQFDNLYVLHSFSKMYGAAGLRIGSVISNENNIKRLYEARPMYELNSIACKFISFVRSNYKEFLESAVRITSSKKYIETQLALLSNVVTTYGNFVIVEKNDKVLALLNNVSYKELTVDGVKFIRITVPDINIAKKLFNVHELL